MAEEKAESKKILEREFVVPLRMEWLKVPKYKRAAKAVKALKEFIAQHMKIYDRDLRKVRVDIYLNNEIRFRGMRKPLGKVKVKAVKYEDGTVSVHLVDLPKHIEFELARKAKKQAEALKREKEAKEEPKSEAKPEEQKIEDTKEKEQASKIATEQLEKSQAKQMEHTSKTSQQAPKIQRKALKK